MSVSTAKIDKMPVVLSRRALKGLSRLSHADLGRFDSAIGRIETGHGGKMMPQAHGLFRGRITDSLRFIYLIHDSRIIVLHVGGHQESDRFVSFIVKQGVSKEQLTFH